MTELPGSGASWDPKRDRRNQESKHPKDVPQHDMSCFLVCRDSFRNYVQDFAQ